MEYECVVCHRVNPHAGEPLKMSECETCGEVVCELCAPDHETICGRLLKSAQSSLCGL